MEYESEVIGLLGIRNFNLIVDNISSGRIKTMHVKKIALKMKHGVHGVFELNHKKDTCELVDTFKLMLDHWWEKYLHGQDVDAVLEFIHIFEDIELNHIAQSMKKSLASGSDEKGILSKR